GSLEKLMGKMREHHVLQHMLLSSEIPGKISRHLHAQLPVEAVIRFIGVYNQHLLSPGCQTFRQQCCYGALSAPAFSTYRYLHRACSSRYFSNTTPSGMV